LDEYDLRARFIPAAIVTLPGVAALFAILPSARSIYGITIGPVIELVIVLFLVRVARDEGKRIEHDLFRAWDGPPTTRFLRHRCDEPHVEPNTRDRYKTFLTQLAPGLRFPTADQEHADPDGADKVYASAVSALRERRRGKPYRLVFSENCNFGMMRNLLGLKHTGLVIGGVSALVCAVKLYVLGHDDATIFALLLAGIVIAALLRFVTPLAVKRGAEAYATALLRTCEPTAHREAKRKSGRGRDKP
jgi:hypothetical protein